jgi:putative transposase
MPRRNIFFVPGEFYHIFNHSVASIPIFKGARESEMFLNAAKFYLQPNPPIKFSLYRISKNRFPLESREKLVTIINYCIMPNHFHFTLKEEKEGGIKQFIQRISNSFAHYFSTKYKKRGHVFEDKFKAIHIETEEQLLHLSRYIHLNPVTSYLVENPDDYLYSSYNIYIGKEISDFVDPSPVLNNFSATMTYKEFVLSQKDYQRTIHRIKHLLLE